jgi:hypothetical protein
VPEEFDQSPAARTDPAQAESHETLARREMQSFRSMVLAEAQLERRKHLLELLTRERRVVRTEIADREDAHQREMRKLNARLASLNQEIRELRLPPGLQQK